MSVDFYKTRKPAKPRVFFNLDCTRVGHIGPLVNQCSRGVDCPRRLEARDTLSRELLYEASDHGGLEDGLGVLVHFAHRVWHRGVDVEQADDVRYWRQDVM